METPNEQKNNQEYISLQEATKFCNYSQEYLSLRARQGKLKSVKLGRNWVTTQDWLSDYLTQVNEYSSSINNNHKNAQTIEQPKKTKAQFAKELKTDQSSDYLAASSSSPPSNLPVAKLPEIKFGYLRSAFLAGLVLVLVAAGAVFGKETLLQTYGDASVYVQKTVKELGILSDKSLTVTDNYESSLSSASDTFFGYAGWMKGKYIGAASVVDTFLGYTEWVKEKYTTADRSVEQKISGTLGGLTSRKFSEQANSVYFSVSNYYSKADRLTGEKIVGFAKFFSENYSTADYFVEQKIIQSWNGAKAASFSFRSELSKTPQAVISYFNRLYGTASQTVTGTFNFMVRPWQGTAPGPVAIDTKELDELKQRIDEFEQEPVVVKRVEVEKVVEPVKEVTKEYQTIQQVTRVDDEALAQVRANITYLEGEIAKRLYAPGGVVSQTIYVTEPVSSPKIYQENGEIVLQTVGSGNVILSAATGLQLHGQQVVIESNSQLNPIIFLASPTRIGGDTTISGDLSVGDLNASDITASTVTLSGALTATAATSTFAGVEATAFKLTTGATNNYVLTSDASGSATWQAATGGAGSSAWTTTTNLMYPKNDEVVLVGGSSTTSEGYKLEVIGKSLFDGIVASASSTYLGDFTVGNQYSLFIDSSTGYASIGTTTQAGLFTVGTTTPALVVDPRGWVGIATTSPSYQFAVQGDLYATTLYGSGSNLTGIVAGQWTQSGTDLYPNTLTWNVGIATSSPRYALDVWGDLAIGTSTDTNTPILYVNSGDGGRVGIGTTTLAGLLTVGTTTPALVVDPRGWVGIATTSPSFQFAVQGDLYATTLYGDGSNLTGIVASQWTQSGTDLYPNTLTWNTGIATTSPRYSLDVWGDAGFGTSTDTNTPALYVNSGDGGRVGIGTTTLAGLFTVGTTTPALVVDPAGNVGIGTDSPALYKLYVSGQSYFLDDITTPGGITINGSGTVASTVWIFKGAGNHQANLVIGNSDVSILTNNSAASFTVNGRWSEASTGNHPLIANVAIKPTTIDANSATVSDTASLYVQGSASTTVVSGNNYSLWVDDEGTFGQISRIDGKLAIATTTPRYTLDVWGDLAIGTSTDTNTPILYVNSGDGGRVGIGTTTLAGLFTVGTTTPALVVDPRGYVGIATTSPSYQFAVQGDLYATTLYGDGSNLTGITSGGSNWGWAGPTVITPSTTDGTIGIIIQASSTFAGNFTVGNGLLFVDTTNNRIGVGTSTPYAKLTINESDDFGFGSFNASTVDTMEGAGLNWHTNNPSFVATSTETSIVKVGGQSLHIYASTTPEDVAVRKIYATPGDFSGFERMSFWIYADKIATSTATTTQIISIGIYNSNNVPNATTTHQIKIQSAGRWQYEEWNINGLANTTSVDEVFFRIDVNNIGTINFYIDQIRLYDDTERAAEMFVDKDGNLVVTGRGGIELVAPQTGAGTLPGVKVSGAVVELGQPLSVNTGGNVGFDYDIELLNTGLSQITSEGPLRISAGDSNSSENLMLAVGGTGDIVVGLSNASSTFKINQAAWASTTAFIINSETNATSSPSSGLFQLITDVNADESVKFVINAAGMTAIGTSTLDYQIRVWGDAGFGAYMTPTLYVDSANNKVGIATTSPRYKLDVWGDIGIGTSTDTNTPAFYVDSGEGGRVGIGTTTLAGLFTVGTTTPALVVDPRGWVGVATTSPSYQFAVQGDLYATTLYGDGSNLTGITESQVSDLGNYLTWANASTTYLIQSEATNTLDYWETQQAARGSNSWNWIVSGTTMYSTSTATTIGVSTTTPRYALDVWGDFSVGTSTDTNTPALYVDSGEGGRVGIGTTTLAGLLTVGTSTPYLVVGPNGNVGIASTTPSDTFSVQGNIMGSGNVIFYGATATTTVAGGLIVDTSTLFVDPYNNRVGIGTTTPSAALTINESSDLAFGSFNEKVIDNMEGSVLGWTRVASISTTTESSIVKVGGQSLKFTASSTEDAVLRKTFGSAQDWSSYERVSFWIYADRIATSTATTTQLLTFQIYDANNPSMIQQPITFKEASRWQYEEVALNATGTAAYDGVTYIQFRTDFGNIEDINFYVDQIRAYNSKERAAEMFVDKDGTLVVTGRGGVELVAPQTGAGTLPGIKVSGAVVELGQPLSVNTGGNVGFDYDIELLNTGLSQITSEGPLRISAGDSNHAENLTLAVGGTGDIIVDLTASSSTFIIAHGIDASNTVPFIINSESYATTSLDKKGMLFQIISDASATDPTSQDDENIVFEIDVFGGYYYDTTAHTPAGDVAENYLTDDETIKAGDVVRLSSQGGLLIEKTDKQYDDKMIGVVSTRPALIMAYNLVGSVRQVALTGRVPVKVSNEGGQIQVGDPLTSASSTPGAAMKATGSGRILGYALEDFNATSTAKILAFISLNERGTGNLTVFEDESGYLSLAVNQNDSLKTVFRIDEQGNVVIDSLKVRQLEVETGITIYDRATSEPYCVYIENGAIQTVNGACQAGQASASGALSGLIQGVGDACTNGENRPCGTEVGTCQIGVQICEQGAWGECIGSVGPSAELCDGVDNNCNGETDEGNICSLTGPASTSTKPIVDPAPEATSTEPVAGSGIASSTDATATSSNQ